MPQWYACTPQYGHIISSTIIPTKVAVARQLSLSLLVWLLNNVVMLWSAHCVAFLVQGEGPGGGAKQWCIVHSSLIALLMSYLLCPDPYLPRSDCNCYVSVVFTLPALLQPWCTRSLAALVLLFQLCLPAVYIVVSQDVVTSCCTWNTCMCW